MNDTLTVVDEAISSQDEDIGDLASDEELLGGPPDEVGKPSIRSVVFKFLDDPASGNEAKYYSLFQMLVLLLYITLLCYSSLYHKERGGESFEINTVFILDTVVTVIFTLDYLIRLVCVRDWAHLKSFLTDGMNIVDVLSILPYYIVLVPIHPGNLQPLRALRVIRLVRVFRLYRLYRHRSTLLRVFIRALEKARGEIYFLFALLVIVMVFFGMAIYYVETSSCGVVDGSLVYTHGPHKGKATSFQDIPASFWWAIVTTAGVGYGDMYPVTIGGKIVAAGLMFGSFLFVAFPVTFLTAAYTSTYAMYRKEKSYLRLGKSFHSSRPTSPITGTSGSHRRLRSTNTANSLSRNRGRSPSRLSNSANTSFAVCAVPTSRSIRSIPNTSSEADGVFIVNRRVRTGSNSQEQLSQRRPSDLDVDSDTSTHHSHSHRTGRYSRSTCINGCATSTEMREILAEMRQLREDLRVMRTIVAQGPVMQP